MEREIRVGFVYDSKVCSSGWSYAHDQGRRVVDAMPGVSTYYVEGAASGPGLESALMDMGSRDFDIVFVTGRGGGDEVLKAAKIFRDTVFLYFSFGSECAVNAAPYAGRMYQARFLTGMVAGAMTRNNTLGYVAASPTVEAIRGINAFALGAGAVNPEARVMVAWTGSRYVPDKEKKAAEELIDRGADIITQDQDSPAVREAVREQGIYSIGCLSDTSGVGPGSCLTAAVWHWSVLYKKVVEDVRAGRWKSEPVWWGLERGLVDTASFDSMVPGDVQDMVLSKKIGLSSGRIKVFTGPVMDREGRLRIPEGQNATDEDLLGMDWFVRGVEEVSMEP